MIQHPRLRTVLEAWTGIFLALILIWFVFWEPPRVDSYEESSRTACAAVHEGMTREEAMQAVQAKLDPSSVSLEENYYAKPGEKVLVVDGCMISFSNEKVSSREELTDPKMLSAD